MSNYEEKLKAPFPEKDIEWRVQRDGQKNGKWWAIVVPYINNRAVQDRLDEVFSPDFWQSEFHVYDKGVVCRLTYWSFTTNGWVHKEDGAEFTDIESFKGGLSGAMKRAAVQLGIGRYLYEIDGPVFANVHEKGTHKAKNYRWDPPKLPGWALPGGGTPVENPERSIRKPKIQDPPEPDDRADKIMEAFDGEVVKEKKVENSTELLLQASAIINKLPEDVRHGWMTRLTQAKMGKSDESIQDVFDAAKKEEIPF